jgi:hypothetical protein
LWDWKDEYIFYKASSNTKITSGDSSVLDKSSFCVKADEKIWNLNFLFWLGGGNLFYLERSERHVIRNFLVLIKKKNPSPWQDNVNS